MQATSQRTRIAQRLLLSLALLCAGAGGEPLATTSVWPPAAAEPALELVESFPSETDLDHPAIPDAADVWLEMIRGATESLRFAQFYASNEPGSRLEPIIRAIEDAAARGVRVRFLAEKKFYATYPQTLDRLRARDGIEVRILNVASLTGGVHHAKYFLVDDDEAFIGSQNFDWRALEHIQELGVRIRDATLACPFADLFEMDWALAPAEGSPLDLRSDGEPATGSDPAQGTQRLADRRKMSPGIPLADPAGSDTLWVTPLFSPRDWLPCGAFWDLPRIVELMDEARRSVCVQLLTYGTVGRDGEYFEDLESALRRAAARGVKVQLLVSEWALRRGTVEGLQSLQALPRIEVRYLRIPPGPTGFIPYARVAHAKYMVVDETAAWIGTSNWERDHFYASRNAGLLLEGPGLPAALSDFFRRGWDGPYAQPISPCVDYPAPRIAE